MERDVHRPLEQLLSFVANEWFRVYGTNETQLRRIRSIVEANFTDRIIGED